MEVKAVSFTGKVPTTPKAKKACNKAMEEIIGQSDKDYFALTRKPKSESRISDEDFIKKDFIKKAKEFFRNIFE